MKNACIIVATIIIAVILYELFIILIWRKQRRKKIYKLAEQRAKEKWKRLFVIGDPNNDNTSIDGKADYGCGDLCLDISGCDICPNGVKDKVENLLPKLHNDSYVIFASVILEYVDDFEMVKKELYRVSGGDLFIVNLEPYSFKTMFFPNLGYGGKFKRKRIIYDAPPYSKEIIYKELDKPISPVLKITDGVGVTSCLSVRLDNFCTRYKKNQNIAEIDSSEQFGFYKDYPEQDVSKILFKPYNPNIPVPYSDFKHSWQFKDYDKIKIEDLYKIAMNVCNPSDIVIQKSNEIQRIIGNRCVVLYRGNDKSKEIKPIPYDSFIKTASDLKEKSFYVQTDEQEFYDYFKSKFPDTIYYSGLPMMKKNNDTFSKGREDEPKSQFAIKFLAAIYAIAQARTIILPTGNTGLWAAIYRGNTNGVRQLRGECTEDMHCDIVNRY